MARNRFRLLSWLAVILCGLLILWGGDSPEVLGQVKKKKKGGRPGEINAPAAKGERIKDRLKAGDPAPDFSLPLLHSDQEVRLSSFKGQKPVVLIFASYT